MGNIRSGSQARNIAVIPENHPQTASLVSDHAASVAEYERAVLERSEEAANTRAVRIHFIYPAYKAHIPFSVLPAAEASAISSQATIPAPAPEPQSPQQGVEVQETYKLASTRIQKYWFNWTKRSASNMPTTRECASFPVHPIYLSSSPYPL